MGAIYSLNEQEPTNFPPVVPGCVIKLSPTNYKMGGHHNPDVSNLLKLESFQTWP